MKAKNKWNGKTYTVKSKANGVVSLVRDTDNHAFEIKESEYRFNYIEIEVDKLN